jgi:hypothetical protein
MGWRLGVYYLLSALVISVLCTNEVRFCWRLATQIGSPKRF